MRSGSAIADAIQRFRQSPPRSRQERSTESEGLKSAFWWRAKNKAGAGTTPWRSTAPASETETAEEVPFPQLSRDPSPPEIAASRENAGQTSASLSAADEDMVRARMSEEAEDPAPRLLQEEEEEEEERPQETSPPSPVVARGDDGEAAKPSTPEVAIPEKARSRDAEEPLPSPEPPAQALAAVAVEETVPPTEEAARAAGLEERGKEVGRKVTLQAFASQHPKLFRALQTKVGASSSMDYPEAEESPSPRTEAIDVAASLDSVETLDTIVDEPLGSLEDVIDEADILGEESDDDDGDGDGDDELEEDDVAVPEPVPDLSEKAEGGEDQGENAPTPVVEKLQDVLEGALGDARSSFEKEEEEAGARVAQAPDGDEARHAHEAPSEESSIQSEAPRAIASVGEVEATAMAAPQAGERVPTPEEYAASLRDSGDEMIKKVLSEIEDQVGSDVFTSDLATNLELQAMIRRQIESVQHEAGTPSPSKDIEDALASAIMAPSTAGPPTSAAPAAAPAAAIDMSSPATPSDSVESTMEKYKRYNDAAESIQRAYRSFRKTKKKEVNTVARKQAEEKAFKAYLSNCTGKVDKIWLEVSGSLAKFPSIFIQLYQDALIMANKKIHHHLRMEEAVNFLASVLPFESGTKTYMQGLLQIEECGDTLSVEQLHAIAMGNLFLMDLCVADPTTLPQLSESLDTLKSDNAKHVFDQLDIERTKKMTIPRIACGFEILYEDAPAALRGLLKRILHHLAVHDMWEATYADIIRIFHSFAGIEQEEETSVQIAANDGGDAAPSLEDPALPPSDVDLILSMKSKIDASLEENTEKIEKIYDELDRLAGGEDDNDSKWGSGESVNEIIKGIEDLPDDDLDEIQADLRELKEAEIEESAAPSAMNEPESVMADAAAQRAKGQEQVDVPAPTATETSKEEGESGTSGEESRDTAAHHFTAEDDAGKVSPPLAETDVGLSPGSGMEGNQPSPPLSGGKANPVLDKAMDRVRLAKKLSHQKKVRDNVLSQIGNLDLEGLLEKLPVNCKLKESLQRGKRGVENQHHPHRPRESGRLRTDFASTDARDSQASPGLGARSGAGRSAGAFAFDSLRAPGGGAPSDFAGAGGLDQGGGVNHARLSNVSVKICNDLDGLLSRFGKGPPPPQPREGRAAPASRDAYLEAPSRALPPYQEGPTHANTGQGWSNKNGLGLGGYPDPFPFTYPFYGAQGLFQPQYSPGGPPTPSAGHPPNTPPQPAPAPSGAPFGGFGLNVETLGGFGVSGNPGSRSGHQGGQGYHHSVEDSFQYISKQGWSKVNFPRPPPSIETFERDDLSLKRAYVNTWQQVQAVYHK